MSNAASGRVLSSLRTADGIGIVRTEDRFDTDIDDLWTALTDPARLLRWMGEVTGDLRVGGEFRAHFFASGWEGTGRVEECEAPHRLQLVTVQSGEPAESVIVATLTADGDQTVLIIEERGIPLDQLPGYGAGWQIHLEDLADHIAGLDRRDPDSRWAELVPTYEGVSVSG